MPRRPRLISLRVFADPAVRKTWSVFCRVTEDKIAEMKLKVSLVQAMRLNPGTGVRVTIESFVAEGARSRRSNGGHH